jgi:E3 ubiquitin-protein ligase RLIM
MPCGRSSKRLRLEDKCAVCLAAFVGGEVLKVLPCLHGFHGACAEQWLADNDACPMCKQSVVTDADTAEKI